MAIPQEFIQELKARTDIADVISSYVSLKKSGRNLMGLCPFHNEKTPSFSVSPENGFFHCFGCGVGGDVITFIKRIENLDYVDAIKFLAQRAGMNMPEENRNNDMARLRMRILEANREAARFYHKQLYSPQGRKALEYLRGRGLTEKTIIHFGLGYSPASRFELVNHLREMGFTSMELIQANLANESRRGNPYDRFSDRVMFPIIDLRGNVIAFGGRIMSDIKPKYLNTSDTPVGGGGESLVFNKSRNLFSLQFAKNHANGQLILVEGYMDVIALHQAGIENAVASLGTALTQEQAMLMKRYCDEVVICYDSDQAGQKAAERAISILSHTGLRVKVMSVPDGKDPDEFIRSHGENGAARFRMLIDKSGNDIEYRMNKIRSRYDLEQPQQRADFLTEAAKILAGVDNPITRDVYTAELASQLNVDKSSIASQVNRNIRRHSREHQRQQQREIQREISAGNNRINTEKPGNLKAANAEEALIALIMKNPDIAQYVFDRLPPDKLVTSFNRRIYESIKSRSDSGYDFTLTDLSGDFTSDEVSEIARMLASRTRENNPKTAADEYINVLIEETDKLTPEQIAQADEQTIMEHLRKMRNKKK